MPYTGTVPYVRTNGDDIWSRYSNPTPLPEKVSSTVRVTWGGFEELFRQTSPEAAPLSRAVEDHYSALLRASNSLQNKWRFRGESVSKAEGAEEKMNEILSAESNYLHVFVLGDSAPTCSIVWSLHGFLQQ